LPPTIQQIHGYCAMCTSRCGVIATVRDGRLTHVNADPEHPNGCICVKGAAAPEIVYSDDRLRHPMMRSRAKGDPNPGWVPVTWDHALNIAASRLNDIKANDGAEAVVFSRATTAGSAAIDFDGWIQRLANAFGSPNFLTSNHICTWNRRVGSKYTYGIGMPLPDFDHTRCMLLWGINPTATSPAQALRINRARNRGAKLIVVDPRRTALAAKADCWLRVKPGTDGELAMAMIHVLIEEALYARDFTRTWTNAPYLLRLDNHRLLTVRDLHDHGDSSEYLIWDERRSQPVSAPASDTVPALEGRFELNSARGERVSCEPVFQSLKRLAAQYCPERSERITAIPALEVRKAVRLFASEQPSCYCTWVGLEQDRDAMQTNRAVCTFYALTGQFDQRGSNVIFATPNMNSITGRELLPDAKARLRLGAKRHPLGPQSDPGLVQAADVYDAILTRCPYPVKAIVAFGGDPLLGHGDPLRGKAALEALDFYLHVDTTINPSAMLADLVLPAATCWEREALLPFSEIAEDTMNWTQLRPAVVPPLHESRADTEIIFAFAEKLGLEESFFGGDIEAALRYQLAPSGLTVQELHANPAGLRVNVQTRHRKYDEYDPATKTKRGLDTPTGKIEIYSTALANAGYAALPCFDAEPEDNDAFPLTLTFFRDIHFTDEQHRNIPRLRRAFAEPVVEIHPSAAQAQGIDDGEWIYLETRTGKVRLKAKFNDSLHPKVVATVYGWWQGCRELNLAGYEPFSENGANANLLIANSDSDAISASVAHRGQRGRVRK
jgi:anaerobic selenocysteine-containing dehydrogenase